MAPCSCPSSVLCHLPSLLLLLQLPPGCSKEPFQVIAPPHPIMAELGEDVTLPCHLYPVMSAENMELRWFRSHFLESVLVYQDQQEWNTELMAQYEGRTSLLGEFLSEGKAAVTIHKVKASDNGLYTCFFSNGAFSEQANLELVVAGVGSDPKVHIIGPEADGVCVVCSASGWFPKPQVQWSNSRGEKLLPLSEMQTQDTEGLFRVEMALVVRDSAIGSVTCSILNPILHQEKAMTVLIPEPFFPQASSWKPAFLVSLPLLLLLLLGASCYTRKEHSTYMQELWKQQSLCWDKEKCRQTKEEALKDRDVLQAILDQRKAAYLTAWKKAQLYADWRKEQFQAWSVTLDPASTHPSIVLSPDKKSVTHNNMDLHSVYFVLGHKDISSGRCYWEVEVRNGDRSEWELGVCTKDETRKGNYTVSPSNGFWVVRHEDYCFFACTSPPTPLYLRQFPHRMGVFLDYDQRDVSFYNMTDGSHIYSFSLCFISGTLFPCFRCIYRDVSLILCPLEARLQKSSGPINHLPSLGETVGPSGEGFQSGFDMDGTPPGPEAPFLPCILETMSP